MTTFLQVAAPVSPPPLLDLPGPGGQGRRRFSLLHVSQEDYAPVGRSRSARQEHAHDVYHLVLYQKGRDRFMLQGERVPAVPDMLALSAPGEKHCFSPCDGGGVSYHELTFALEGPRGAATAGSWAEILSQYAGRTLQAPPLPEVLPAAVATELRDGIERLLAGLARGDDWFGVYRQVLDLFAVLIAEVFDTPAQQPDLDPRLELARRQLQQRFREPLGAAELAAAIGWTSGYFIRAFRRAFGVSPVAYRQQLRLHAAQVLLRTTSLSCKEIAARTGFPDPYSFAKFFRASTGRTAGAYRRKIDGVGGKMSG